ncbi:MAG: sugar O-acyltransferase (sialic acid O-acetyltransferase NeuD family) [Psychroserpens sp.]|jgi:sugar O-acyltransferase (sialic acid O-acetyltransferase NeuD family)
MIIWGAKGLAKEILNNLNADGLDDEVIFLDDISTDFDSFLNEKYIILKNLKNAKDSVEKAILIGVGGAYNRYKISNMINEKGFSEVGYRSTQASIGNLDNNIHETVTVLSGATITISVTIGQSCLINKNVIISHDVKIGAYTELSPGVKVLGRVVVGDFCEIGANATILPDIKIGDHCKIGAGAVVTKNIPDNSVVVGVPGKIIGHKE